MAKGIRNLSVRSGSDLTLDATVRYDEMAPGLHVAADLRGYESVLGTDVQLWAEIIEPSGELAIVILSESCPGVFSTLWTARRTGEYQFLVRAEGRTPTGASFLLEKSLTATVPASAEQAYDSGADYSESECCKWIECLLEQFSPPATRRAAGIRVVPALASSCQDR